MLFRSFRAEDYVVQEDAFAIVTADGWIKRIRQNNEVSSTRLREGDSILRAHPLNTLDSVAFFTSMGSFYTLKVSDFPSSSGYGDPIQKILKFKDGEKIVESFGICANAPAQGSILESYKYMIKEGDVLILVSKSGTGFALKLEEIGAVKRNGKRIMKLREGDELAVACHFASKLAMFTRQASGLIINTKEIPVREAAVVGVALMGVREDDVLVAGISFDSKAKFNLKLSAGKDKEIASGEMLSGHRALKGNKVVSRAEITGVERI